MKTHIKCSQSPTSVSLFLLFSKNFFDVDYVDFNVGFGTNDFHEDELCISSNWGSDERKRNPQQ